MTDLTELAAEVLGLHTERQETLGDILKRELRKVDHPIWYAHKAMVAKLAALTPPRIYIEPEPEDFENVRDYLADAREIINAWLSEVGKEVQSNAIVKLDMGQFSIEGLSDCEGECNRAAAALAEDREWSR